MFRLLTASLSNAIFVCYLNQKIRGTWYACKAIFFGILCMDMIWYLKRRVYTSEVYF